MQVFNAHTKWLTPQWSRMNCWGSNHIVTVTACQRNEITDRISEIWTRITDSHGILCKSACFGSRNMWHNSHVLQTQYWTNHCIYTVLHKLLLECVLSTMCAKYIHTMYFHYGTVFNYFAVTHHVRNKKCFIRCNENTKHFSKCSKMQNTLNVFNIPASITCIPIALQYRTLITMQ